MSEGQHEALTAKPVHACECMSWCWPGFKAGDIQPGGRHHPDCKRQPKLIGEAYLTDREIIVVGDTDDNDESHNCDAMGCSSVSHVVYRAAISAKGEAQPLVWQNTTEADAKWWRDSSSGGWEIRALYTAPQPAIPAGIDVDEAAGFCRLAFGYGAADFNAGVDAMRDRMRELLAAAQQPTGFDAEFLAKRLGRVAKLVGVTMPSHMSHEQIAEVAGTILGDIAFRLERNLAQQPSQPQGEHPPLPDPAVNVGAGGTWTTICHVRYFTADQMHDYLDADRAQRRAVEPSKPNRITLDFKQATELLEMFGGEPSEITLIDGSGHSGPGLYAYYEQIPEEGAMYLGQVDDEAVPEQRHAVELTAEQKDAERLNYLQDTGSTVEIVPGHAGWRFRVGGLFSSVSNNIRLALDEAIAADRAARGGAA